MPTMMEQLIEQTVLWTPRLVTALGAVFLFWILSRVVSKGIMTLGLRTDLDDEVASLVARASHVTIFLFGIVTALGTLGVDVSALVTGLGLTGFALGFALKDTVSNLLAGILLLVYRPFSTGDFIKVSGHAGEVKTIDLRYTTLLSQGSVVLIPNSHLFTSAITILDRVTAGESDTA